MDLNGLFVFVKVAQLGSFREAARVLKMPNSTVSAKVSLFEKELGVTLIQRTTRRLRVTPEGHDYLMACMTALNTIEEASQNLNHGQKEVLGPLRITAPVELGNAFLPKIAIDFQKQFPKVQLDFIFSDHSVDFISESIDLALRVGKLKDSSLMTKKIGNVYFSLYASPSYLKNNGTPKNPRELENHKCIIFSQLDSGRWKLISNKGAHSVKVKASLLSNDLNFIKALVIANQGIALLPNFICHKEVYDEKLNQILPEWTSNVRPLQFVYPSQSFITPKLKAFVDFATISIQKQLLSI